MLSLVEVKLKTLENQFDEIWKKIESFRNRKSYHVRIRMIKYNMWYEKVDKLAGQIDELRKFKTVT